MDDKGEEMLTAEDCWIVLKQSCSYVSCVEKKKKEERGKEAEDILVRWVINSMEGATTIGKVVSEWLTMAITTPIQPSDPVPAS